MKNCLSTLLLLPWLAGCLSARDPLTRSDVVGTWQCKPTGLLSSTQTLLFHDFGSFAYHSSDPIIGLEMRGRWEWKDGHVRVVPEQIKVRGKPDVIPPELADGFVSEAVAKRGGKLVMQIGAGDEFERISEKGTVKELR